jgi:hypothetical protein
LQKNIIKIIFVFGFIIIKFVKNINIMTSIFGILRNKKEDKDNKEIRIVLSEDDFINLTSGGIVEKRGVKICLADIGLERMSSIVARNHYNMKYGK